MEIRENGVILQVVADGGGEFASVASGQHVAAFADARQVVVRDGAFWRVATLEPGMWRLDGSFALPGASGNLCAGFVSRDVSGANGIFAIQPSLEVRFGGNTDLPDVTFMFDPLIDGVVSTMQVQAFNAAGTVVFDRLIFANAQNGAPHALSTGEMRGAFRILARMVRTATPFRRARIARVHFAPAMIFTNDDILGMGVLHEADVEGKGLPANKLSLKIANEGRFSVLDSPRAMNILQSGATMQLSLANRHVYEHFANYYLDKWDITNAFVKMDGYSRVKQLDGGVFMGSHFGLEHLGDLARRIGRECGVEVIVPHVMNTYPRFPGFTGNVTHRQALAQLAKLASCTIFEDKAGRVHFVDLTSIHQGTLTDDIDFEESFAPPEISQNAYYNGIRLSEHKVSLEQGLVASVEFDVASALSIRINYDNPVWGNAAITVNQGFGITNIHQSATHMRALITGNGRATVTVRGWRASMLTTQLFYPAPWKKDEEDEKPYIVNLPMFITNAVHMGSVRAWFLNRKFALLERLMFCKTKWRQRTTSELGDNTHVQIDISGRTVRTRAIKHEITLDKGIMRGATKGVVLE